MLLGISGKIGSGKDTVGKIIQALTFKDSKCNKSLYEVKEWINDERKNSLDDNLNSNFKIKKFAGKLKEIVALLTGCTIEELESQEFKNKQLGKEWDYVLDAYGKPVDINKYCSDTLFIENPERFTKHYTYRDLLQFIGTQSMRDVIHENIWINALFADYKGDFKSGCLRTYDDSIHNLPNWIITDTRFPNEKQAIEDRGGITIRVERPFDIIRRTASGENIIEKFDITNIEHQNLFAGELSRQHISETALDLKRFTHVIYNNGTIEDLIEKVKVILQKEKII